MFTILQNVLQTNFLSTFCTPALQYCFVLGMKIYQWENLNNVRNWGSAGILQLPSGADKGQGGGRQHRPHTQVNQDTCMYFHKWKVPWSWNHSYWGTTDGIQTWLFSWQYPTGNLLIAILYISQFISTTIFNLPCFRWSILLPKSKKER